MTIEFDEGERTWAKNNVKLERDSDMAYKIEQNEIIKIIDGEMQNPNGWAMSAILEKLESLGYVTDFARDHILNHCGYIIDEKGNEVKRPTDAKLDYEISSNKRKKSSPESIMFI
jgi:hypothetical protein